MSTFYQTNTYPTVGQKVKIVKLGKTTGWTIHQRHLTLRRLGITGIVRGWVPGHGGDVWFVQYGQEIAAYDIDEIEPA